MISLALLLALASPEKALILDVKAGNGTDDVARAATSLLAVELQKHYEVITSADVRALMEQEANKQALGCDATAASCLAEIAGAIGATLAFYGDANKLGDLTLVTLNAFDAKAGRALGRVSVEVKNPSELPLRIRESVPALLGEAPAVAATPPPPDTAFSMLGIAGAVVGGVGVVGAVAGGGYALAMSGIESNPASTRDEKALAFNTHDAAGLVAVGGAVVAVVGGALVVVDVAE